MDSQIEELFFYNINNTSSDANNDKVIKAEEPTTIDNKMKSKLPLIILGCGLILILFK